MAVKQKEKDANRKILLNFLMATHFEFLKRPERGAALEKKVFQCTQMLILPYNSFLGTKGLRSTCTGALMLILQTTITPERE